MENLNKKGKTYQELTFLQVEGRRYLAEQLEKLGPIRFIETLRIIDTGYRDDITITELVKRCQKEDLLIGTDIEKRHQFSAFLTGYLTDQEDWHRVLNPVPEAKRE